MQKENTVKIINADKRILITFFIIKTSKFLDRNKEILRCNVPSFVSARTLCIFEVSESMNCLLTIYSTLRNIIYASITKVNIFVA